MNRPHDVAMVQHLLANVRTRGGMHPYWRGRVDGTLSPELVQVIRQFRWDTDVKGKAANPRIMQAPISWEARLDPDSPPMTRLRGMVPAAALHVLALPGSPVLIAPGESRTGIPSLGEIPLPEPERGSLYKGLQRLWLYLGLVFKPDRYDVTPDGRPTVRLDLIAGKPVGPLSSQLLDNFNKTLLDLMDHEGVFEAFDIPKRGPLILTSYTRRPELIKKPPVTAHQVSELPPDREDADRPADALGQSCAAYHGAS